MKTMSLVVILTLSACAGDPLQGGTDAERYAPAGDVTSCHVTRSPTGCGPEVQCSGALADCVARGCWISGTSTYLYPDGSWRAPYPQPGTWHFDAGKVLENGAPADDFSCP
jgi:hypothetical protein